MSGPKRRASANAARKFTDDERATIKRAALAVWDEIGYDVLSALGDDNGHATVPKRDVVELVLDASRLESRLKRTSGVAPDFVARVAADLYGDRSEIERFLLTDVFTYARYGM